MRALVIVPILVVLSAPAAAQPWRDQVFIPPPNWADLGLTNGVPLGNPEADWILFLNRDGGTYTAGWPDDARTNQSSIPRGGSATIAPYSYGDESWDIMVECVRELYAPFNVYVTDEEPDPDGGRLYVENVVGGNPGDVGMGGGVAGVSPFTCEPIPFAVSYTFAEVYGNNPIQICDTAAHESGHSFGLDHELLCDDPMTYLPECGEKAFQDVDAQCGEWGPRACTCGGDTQNTYRRLMAFVGPHFLPDPPRDIGLPCADDGECKSNYCIEWDGELRCSEQCDFATPGLGCPPSYVCIDLSCAEGACVPGDLGVKPNGEGCADGRECASGHCSDAGVCARPCEPRHDRCPGDGECVARDGSDECGSCVGGPPPAPIGSPCEDGGDCVTGVCAGMDPDEKYCTKRCNETATPETDPTGEFLCPEGYQCEVGICYLDGDGTMGSPCHENEDCVSGVCGPDDFCTAPCEGPGRGCPDGWECEQRPSGRFCVPQDGALPFGYPCESDDQCRSGYCNGDICSRPCDYEAPCPADYTCREQGEGLPPLCDERGGGLLFDTGCGPCRVHGQTEPAGALVWLVALPFLARRRRRTP